MRTFSFLLAAAALTACSGAKDETTDDTGADTGDTAADTDTDTDTALGAFPLIDAATVEEAYGLVQMPASVYMFSAFSVGFGDGVCPQVVTETDTELDVLGDCTSTDGTTYTGRFHVVLSSETEGTVTYEGWGFTEGTQSMLANGTHTVSSTSFSATGTESLDVAITFPNEDGGEPISFSGRWTEFSVGVGGSDGPMPMNATVAVESGPHTGNLVSSGDFVWASDCGSPVGGTVILSGSQDVYLAPQSCDADGCIPWTAADGTTGEVCQ